MDVGRSITRAATQIIARSLELDESSAGGELGTLLDWVAEGKEVPVTWHGKAAARVASVTASFERAKASQAVRGLLDASRGSRLVGLKIKDPVDEGRP